MQWSQGLELAGSGQVGLRRLELVTLQGNEASQRVAEKAGFRRKAFSCGMSSMMASRVIACCTPHTATR